MKTILIAAASVVAFILLIAIIVVIANSSGSDISLKNNTFISYEQDGRYFVAMNGETIGSGFDNEVELKAAKDNSFAYITEDTSEGYNIYILEKKELTAVVSSPISEVIAFADYEPGIVYRDDTAYHFYSQNDESRITKDAGAKNFIIAPDASAVVYTRPKDENANESKLYIFSNGVEDSCGKNNMVPVAVSNNGECIYAYGVTSADYVTKKLYVVYPNDGNETIEIQTGFDRIQYTNISGDEILYTVISAESGYQSFIYSAKKDTSYKVGAGICVPLIADKSVVGLSTLKDMVYERSYFNEGSGFAGATYYVNKKYETSKISQYNGQLNSSGTFFYFINNDGTLNYIDMDDKNRTAEGLAEGVIEFVVTEKDNIYYLDDDGRLMFYKSSTAKRQKVEDDVVNMTFNSYANVLYFDVDEDTKAYMTEEGSTPEIAKFAKAEISTAPEFVDASQKRTFAYVLNADTDRYDIYYTTTGSTYKLLASNCDDLSAVNESIIDEIIDGIQDAIDNATGGSEDGGSSDEQ
ncbi:MAG: hypothetical protein E7641_00470 [Ruminococcaceae bacterium]|nr:hypothetical protein [Oscillospiraceae bacterium]